MDHALVANLQGVIFENTSATMLPEPTKLPDRSKQSSVALLCHRQMVINGRSGPPFIFVCVLMCIDSGRFLY